MEPYTLLVIARTQSLAERLRRFLDVEQHLVRWAPSATEALKLGLSPSLLILELPSSGGVRNVARLKRQFGAPLLALLRARQPVPDGVDAFLPRPFDVEQLGEVIQWTLMKYAPHIVHAAGMSLDTRARRLQMDGAFYQLPPIGCRILALLMDRAGSVVPRDELFRRVWHIDGGDNTRVLDVHIANLRRLLEADPRHPKLILTERRVGYRLQPPA